MNETKHENTIWQRDEANINEVWIGVDLQSPQKSNK